MFSKILIANRGEIACRILRTCRKLGIKTVAVYSEADAQALHVQEADEAHLIGAAPPEESYLNIRSIIEAAGQSQAEAIHPGYGFLSQNADFARACEKADIAFIGPSPKVMKRMGDKLRALKLARKAGLPVLPGSEGEVKDEGALQRAQANGFPLMVKAANGGGGIGIQVVHSPTELKGVMSRAKSAFWERNPYPGWRAQPMQSSMIYSFPRSVSCVRDPKLSWRCATSSYTCCEPPASCPSCTCAWNVASL